MNKKKQKKGSVLVYSLIVMIIMLTMAMGASEVLIRDTQISSSTAKSTQAIQSAGSGVEDILGQISRVDSAKLVSEVWYCETDPINGDVVKGTLPGGSTYDVILYDSKEKTNRIGCSDRAKDVKLVKSLGSSGDVVRALEVEIGGCPNLHAVAEGNAASTGSSQYLDVDGNYAYLADAHGMYIFDISNPDNPQKLSFFPTNSDAINGNCNGKVSSWGGNNVLGIDAVGDYVYLGTYIGGFVVVDVTDKANPLCADQENLGSGNEGWEVNVSGDYAYVSNYQNLAKINIADKNNIIVEGYISLTAEGNSVWTKSHDIENGYAYVVGTDYSRNDRAGLSIVDLSTDTVVGGDYLEDGVTDHDFYGSIDVSGNYAYVGKSNYEGGSLQNAQLVTYDVSDPTNPVLVDTDESGGTGGEYATGIHVSNGRLYLATSSKPISSFDISTPDDPKLLYSAPILDGPPWANDIIKHTDGYLYVAGLYTGEDAGGNLYGDPLLVVQDCN